MKVSYKPSFVKQYSSLEPNLQNEVKEKIELFKDKNNHQQLKLHKLKGRLAGRYSFWVNYRYRIVFIYEAKNESVLLAVGDHDVYK